MGKKGKDQKRDWPPDRFDEMTRMLDELAETYYKSIDILREEFEGEEETLTIEERSLLVNMEVKLNTRYTLEHVMRLTSLMANVNFTLETIGMMLAKALYGDDLPEGGPDFTKH